MSGAEEAVMIVGVITLSIFGGLVVLFIAFVAWDATVCARFIWRIRVAAIGVCEPINPSRLLLAGLRYWVGVDQRPNYLIVRSTDEAVYWPGKEGSRGSGAD